MIVTQLPPVNRTSTYSDDTEPPISGPAGASTPTVGPVTRHKRTGVTAAAHPGVVIAISPHISRLTNRPGLSRLVAVSCPFCDKVHAALWTHAASTPTTWACCRTSGWPRFPLDASRFPVLSLALVAA